MCGQFLYTLKETNCLYNKLNNLLYSTFISTLLKRNNLNIFSNIVYYRLYYLEDILNKSSFNLFLSILPIAFLGISIKYIL